MISPYSPTLKRRQANLYVPSKYARQSLCYRFLPSFPLNVSILLCFHFARFPCLARLGILRREKQWLICFFKKTKRPVVGADRVRKYGKELQNSSIVRSFQAIVFTPSQNPHQERPRTAGDYDYTRYPPSRASHKIPPPPWAFVSAPALNKISAARMVFPVTADCKADPLYSPCVFVSALALNSSFTISAFPSTAVDCKAVP